MEPGHVHIWAVFFSEAVWYNVHKVDMIDLDGRGDMFALLTSTPWPIIPLRTLCLWYNVHKVDIIDFDGLGNSRLAALLPDRPIIPLRARRFVV